MAIIKQYKDIDLTLKLGLKNDIRKKVGVEAINQHLKILLLTEQDDIPFMNNVSSDLRSLLFQPYTVLVRDTIDDLIKHCITMYEPRINITEVINVADKNTVRITVNYIVKQTKVIGNFTTILKRVH